MKRPQKITISFSMLRTAWDILKLVRKHLPTIKRKIDDYRKKPDIHKE